MTINDRVSGYTDEEIEEMVEEHLVSEAVERLGAVRLDVLNQAPVTEADHWLFPGFVSTSDTYLYGQSKVGKSFAVSQLVASLVDGRPFLGETPLSSGHRVLVVATDSGARMAYQQRISELGVDQSMLHLVQVNGEFPLTFWEDTRTLVDGLGISVVVFDHATGGIEGDINSVEDWNKLWNSLKSLGEGVARILVGHATDSKFEGSTIHRPSGSYAATANARARVYLWAPAGVEDPQREIRLVGNNLEGGPREIACRQSEDGYLTRSPEDEQPSSRQERSEQRKDTTSEIIRPALEAPPMPQAQLLERIAASPTVRTSNGDRMAVGTIRNRLREAGTIRWDRQAQKYLDTTA